MILKLLVVVAMFFLFSVVAGHFIFMSKVFFNFAGFQFTGVLLSGIFGAVLGSQVSTK
jgi:hypothetical protein